MRQIIIISNYGLDSDGGGVKVYTRNLVSALKRLEWNSIILMREGTRTKDEIKLSKNKILYIIKATEQLNKLKPKYILSQGGWFTALPAAIYKARHPETRAIYLYHTYYDPPRTLFQKIIRYAERHLMTFILSHFDKVLFVSRGLRRNVEENGALRVPPGWGVLYGAPFVQYPSTDEIEEFRKKFKIIRDRFYILGHGLTALKVKVEGAKLLIHSLTYLPDNVFLMLTRKGKFVEELQQYSEDMGVSDRVIFTGDLENPHVATLVTDLYTHITWGEGGLSIALLEVMSIGKPIIASNVGGIPEVIRHLKEGILIQNNEKELIEKVKFLIEHPKIRKVMSVISKRAVTKRLSWERTAKILVSYFDNILSR